MRSAAGGQLYAETKFDCLHVCDIIGELHYLHWSYEAFLAATWCKRPEKL